MVGPPGKEFVTREIIFVFCIVLRLIEEVLASLFPSPAATECTRWKEITSIRRKKRPKRSRWNNYSSIRSTLKDSSFTIGRRIPPQSRRGVFLPIIRPFPLVTGL